MNHVKVNIDVARNLITVWNNGDCIPFDINGVFMGSMDYLLNIFLTEITAADVKHDKLYKQVFLSDLDINKTEPDINARTTDGNCDQVESHVDNITGEITSYLGKILNLEPNYIKSHLWVFVNAAFDLQTKENPMKGTFRSTFANADVMNKLLSYADFKENQE
nr:DNA topoisomerase 2 [Tanacetum cinerariifolium]